MALLPLSHSPHEVPWLENLPGISCLFCLPYEQEQSEEHADESSIRHLHLLLPGVAEKGYLKGYPTLTCFGYLHSPI